MKIEHELAIVISNVTKYFNVYNNPVIGPLMDIIFFWKNFRSDRKVFTAVEDVSIEIKRGEVVGIIGPNGAGKTTLLKMIAGLLPIDKGNIEVRGKLTLLLALGVGIHPEFSGRENILFGGVMMGMSKKEVLSKVDSIIAFSEIGDFIDQPFKTYSSGMKSRLLFSIAMSVNPDIMIVDEALATGDAAFVAKCERRIREICKTGATVLFVSHNLTQINLLCDRSILMVGGKIVSQGSPLEVFNKYKSIFMQSENERLHKLNQSQKFNQACDTDIKLKSVKFKDKFGIECYSFLTGESMSIDFEFIMDTLESNLLIMIGFIANGKFVGWIDTEQIILDNSSTEIMEIRNIKNFKNMSINISKLLMLNGEYSLKLQFLDIDTRSIIAEMSDVGHFRISKALYPFDNDVYFTHPVNSIMIDGNRVI